MNGPAMKFARNTLAAAITTALAAPVLAQDLVIEEVLVTATKREASAQDIPVSITAVDASKLQELNITDVTDLGKVVPGLIINNVGNQPVPIMRGAGAAGTTDIAVPIYVDNMYRPLAAQGLASYVDIERVEVLRGPQGTLFGRNTLGGLINVIAKKPDFEGFDFGGSVAGGDYGLRRLEGFVNVPISDQMALRVTATDTNRDPYVENTFNSSAGLKDADSTYARAQLFWAPSDNFDMNLGVTYWDDSANGNADYGYKCLGVPVNRTTQQFDGTSAGFLDRRCGVRDGWDGGRPQAGNISNGDTSAMVDPDPFRIAFDFQPVRNIEETSFSLDINYRFAGHHLAIRGAMFDLSEDVITDTDLSSNNALVAGHIRSSEAKQIDITLNSDGDGPLQYTIGAYLFDDTDAGANTYAFVWGYTYTDPADPAWASWLYQGNGGTESTALYGQAEYAFNDSFRATAGLRFSKDKRRSFSLNIDQDSRDDDLPSYAGTPSPVTGDDNHTDIRVGLQHDVGENAMVYGSYSTGYIAGAVEPISNTLLDPNEVRATEFGVKGIYADGKLKLNAAFYNQTYTNLTTTKFVTIGAAQTIVAQQIPGGSMTSRGLELEGQWFPFGALGVDFSIAFDSTEFDDFSAPNRVGAAANNGPDGTGGYPGSDFYIDGAGFFDLTGDEARLSPNLTASVGLNYQFELANGSSLRPWINLYWSDDYKTTNDPIFWAVQDAYTSVDFGASFRPGSRQDLLFSFYMNNATDELIMTDGTMFSRGRAMADFANPRNWGLRVSYNF